jgi:hypothetical protein
LLELRARKLEAGAGEIGLTRNGALEREGRIVCMTAVERGDTEQVVEQRSASEIGLVTRQEVIRFQWLLLAQ